MYKSQHICISFLVFHDSQTVRKKKGWWEGVSNNELMPYVKIGHFNSLTNKLIHLSVQRPSYGFSQSAQEVGRMAKWAPVLGHSM